MKKLVVLFSALVALSSCGTTTQQDAQMLQTKYQTVYRVTGFNYITFDSAHVYHIIIDGTGKIESTVRIK